MKKRTRATEAIGNLGKSRKIGKEHADFALVLAELKSLSIRLTAVEDRVGKDHEYIGAVKKKCAKKKCYNPSTGAFDERYSPLIQEDDFFLPRRPDGTGPDLEPCDLPMAVEKKAAVKKAAVKKAAVKKAAVKKASKKAAVKKASKKTIVRRKKKKKKSNLKLTRSQNNALGIIKKYGTISLKKAFLYSIGISTISALRIRGLINVNDDIISIN